LVAAVLTGGYPEVLLRSAWNRRLDWCRDYVRAIDERDVRDIAQIDKVQQLPRLLRLLAHHSGQLVNYSGLGAPLGLTHVTTQKYAGLFEQLFLTRQLPPWSNNELKRLIKTPRFISWIRDFWRPCETYRPSALPKAVAHSERYWKRLCF
jgi:uncharacterized protein